MQKTKNKKRPHSNPYQWTHPNQGYFKHPKHSILCPNQHQHAHQAYINAFEPPCQSKHTCGRVRARVRMAISQKAPTKAAFNIFSRCLHALNFLEWLEMDVNSAIFLLDVSSRCDCGSLAPPSTATWEVHVSDSTVSCSLRRQIRLISLWTLHCYRFSFTEERSKREKFHTDSPFWSLRIIAGSASVPSFM